MENKLPRSKVTFVLLIITISSLVFLYLILDSINNLEVNDTTTPVENIINNNNERTELILTFLDGISILPDYEVKFRMEKLFDVDNIRLAIILILIISTGYVYHKEKHNKLKLIILFSVYLGVSLSILLNSMILFVFHYSWNLWFLWDYIIEGLAFGILSFSFIFITSKLLLHLKLYYKRTKLIYDSNIWIIFKEEILPKLKPVIFIYTIFSFGLLIKRISELMRIDK